MCPGAGSLDPMVIFFLSVLRNLQLFSIVTIPIYILTNSVRVFLWEYWHSDSPEFLDRRGLQHWPFLGGCQPRAESLSWGDRRITSCDLVSSILHNDLISSPPGPDAVTFYPLIYINSHKLFQLNCQFWLLLFNF